MLWYADPTFTIYRPVKTSEKWPRLKFTITETKLDNTFLLSQFILKGFTPLDRFDRTEHGRGLMLFIRQDIPSKLLPNLNPPGNIENIFVKINLKSKEWLISGFYNPDVSLIQNHTVNLRSQNIFFCMKSKNTVFLYKTMKKPYLNLHFKFHDFSQEITKILSFGFFSFRI